MKKRETVPDIKKKNGKERAELENRFLKVVRTMYIGIPKRNVIKNAQLNHYTSG